MNLLIELIDLAFTIYIVIIIAQVALVWFINFEIVDASNPKAKNLMDLLKKATDPLFKPISRYVPPVGGIDITPLIVILGLSILRNLIVSLLFAVF